MMNRIWATKEQLKDMFPDVVESVGTRGMAADHDPLPGRQLRKDLIDSLLGIIKRQKELGWKSNPEDDHEEADQLLLKYIGDAKIEELFHAIEKWYS